MLGVEAFSKWYPEVYLKKFPAPKRNNNYNWTNENLVSKNFTLDKEEEFKNPIVYTKNELIGYFSTQSNITAVIEDGQMTYNEVENWLNNELSPFYSTNNTRTLNFGNWIKYIHKSI